MRSTTSTAVPLTSMGYPPARNPLARSTTETSKPYRCSQYASAGPAMLAPETRIFLRGTLVPDIGVPSS